MQQQTMEMLHSITLYVATMTLLSVGEMDGVSGFLEGLGLEGREGGREGVAHMLYLRRWSISAGRRSGRC
jgi:hypothetical protein